MGKLPYKNKLTINKNPQTSRVHLFVRKRLLKGKAKCNII